jgi:putative flavoprotein involved in K+ transport
VTLPERPSFKNSLKPFARITFEEYAEYLKNYRYQNNLNVRTDTEVLEVKRLSGGEFLIQTEWRAWVSHYVVNATGYYSQPNRVENADPKYSMHVAEYSGPEQIRNILGPGSKKILIVGGGISAGQTGADLIDAGFDVSISTRSPLRFARFDLENPFVFLSSALLEMGLLKTPIARWLKPFPVPMDGGRIRKLISNIPHHAGFKFMQENEIEFQDGTHADFDFVIFTTGYSPSLAHLKTVDPRTKIEQLSRTKDFEDEENPGLFYIGFEGQRTFLSRYIRGLRLDAKILAEIIANRIQNKESY